MTMFHVDDNGDVKRCAAQKGQCPYGIHGATVEAALAASEAQWAPHTIAPSMKKTPKPARLTAFDGEAYYGAVPPRSIQLEALNAVAQALEADDATQLVAACGTGKSYMGRQLLQHEMLKPDANGIAVILTSSIKLASDTAADLRPDREGQYDRTMGEYGQDYEVIEVHSGVGARADELESVRDLKGTIQADRIRAQLEAAVTAGKRVVIVSTYDSCSKVQEAQAALADERYAADIIMHDEAHNVLGQQRPTTVASADNELTAYTGFHNEIPGAIQARKRLYATASPVLREAPGDAEEPATLEDAIAVAEKMKAGDQWARVTYYSDHAMVGRVSGFISQEEAIEAGCLARPAYAVREARVKGSLRHFQDPVVSPDGTVEERSASAAPHPLTVPTYGAVRATLDALAADPDPDKNPATNVLAYVGSIPQAEAFRESFAAVARAEAGGMSPLEAVRLKDSEDPTLRRRARMALLAANADVRAAHSSSDVEDRRRAFRMFDGKGVEEAGWSPHRRVLANVDIFSEGVSIPEIDAVVISDDEKCSERAMTQAIGRAIRVLPGNDYKTTGHVIVPSLTDGDGVHVNEASVHLAAYGASRVERALVAKKLRGEGVRPDETTLFRVYAAEGGVETKPARAFAQEAASEILPLAAAAETLSAHAYLMRGEDKDAYRAMSPAEQASMVKSRIAEKAALARGAEERSRLEQISAHVAGKTAQELREERRNARVVTSALAVGDVASLSPELARTLIRGGVLTTQDSVAEVSVEDKRAHVAKHAAAVRYAILTNPAGKTEVHGRLQEALPSAIRQNKKVQGDSMKLLRGGDETEATRQLGAAFDELLSRDEFVTAAYELSQERDPKRLPLIAGPLWRSVADDLAAQEAAREARQHAEALQGEQTYRVNRAAVRKTGELSSRTLQALLAQAAQED